MSNCGCNSLRFNKSKTCKSFNFSTWDRFTAYYNNDEKQDFVEYDHNLYACIKSVGSDEVNPKDDTDNGKIEGKYWILAVSGIKGDNGYNPYFRINGNKIQWKYDFEDDLEYRDLFDFDNIFNGFSFSDCVEVETDNGRFYQTILKSNGNDIAVLNIPDKDFVERKEFTTFVDETKSNINNLSDSLTWKIE